MTIRRVRANKNKKCLEIHTSKGVLALPFAKLGLVPTADNTIRKVYVDAELANRAVTYVLESGEEDSVHLDAFLDYNKDPDYMKKMALYNLTLTALELVKQSSLPKREIARKLKTSPAQLYRLLDPANDSKSLDQMVRLVASLGYEVSFALQEPPQIDARDLKQKFLYLRPEELRTIPKASKFKPMVAEDRQAA